MIELVLAAVLGGVVTVVAERILKKRGLLTYSVEHSTVGAAGEDPVFGRVEVSWNGNPLSNLFVSTVELVNASLSDFEGIEVRVFSRDAILLTEKTGIEGTTRVLEWTEEYQAKLHTAGGPAAQHQIDLHSSQRDYHVPTLNRGQTARFSYLTTSAQGASPSLWLDVVHPGVKLKYRVKLNLAFGVAQPVAGIVGLLIGVALLLLAAQFIQPGWILVSAAFGYGLVAQLPGAMAVHAWRRARALVGD